MTSDLPATRSHRESASAPDGREVKRVVAAGFVSAAVEWYDFFLYGSAAALVFRTQFFPELSQLAGTLAALGTFAIGFLARPLGGVVMGHLGDRVGRRSVLVASLLVMGVGTAAIGMLPTYGAIGVWAPILLTLLRFAQGFGVGGQWGGAALMAVEHAPAGRRGFYGSFPQMGVPAGLIAANFSLLAMTALLTPQQFSAWGWRIPFLGSLLLVVVGLVIRMKVSESPYFVAAERAQRSVRAPLVDVLRSHRGSVLLAAGTFIATNGVGYIFMVYALSYGAGVLHIDTGHLLAGVLCGAFCWMVTLLGWGHLSDRIGRRRTYLYGSVLLLACSSVFLGLLETRKPVLLVISFVLMGCALAGPYAPQSALFAELFPTEVRYTGASLSYQVGAILGGGLAPLIATSLQSAWNSSISVTIYLVAICLVSLLCVLPLDETSTRRLSDVGTPRKA